MTRQPPERLLITAEVAALFRVKRQTITRWAAAGKIGSFRTLGGQRRYPESGVRKLLAATEAGEQGSERMRP